MIEKDNPELIKIIEAATKTALAKKVVHIQGRPIITNGEVRPTDIVPVIAPNAKGIKSVFPMQWGFLAVNNKRAIFNARTETANQKPTFRDAWKSHRCIIPASYYFEWQHFKSPDGKKRTGDKFIIQPTGCTSTWLCGLYRIENGYPVFVILTQEPTNELAKIHDRMPLILPKNKIDDWIDLNTKAEELLQYSLSDMIIEKA